MSDSPVIGFLNKAVDLILLNFLWIVCSLPVVTMGASTAAMYYVCIISIRQGDGYVLKRFFGAFKDNFLKATIVWIVLLAIGAVCLVDILFWERIGGAAGRIMKMVSGAFIIVWMLICEFIYPVMAKFEGNIKTIVKNSVAMAIGYLPYTLGAFAIDIIFVTVNLKAVTANVVSVFIGFALVAYVKSFLFYRVFMNHMDERFDDFEREKRLDEAKTSGDGEI